MTDRDETLVKEILAAEARRVHAIETSDWDTVEQIYAEDFTFIHTDGRSESRQSVIGHIRTKPRKITRKNLTVRPLGDAAIVSGGSYTWFGPQSDGSPAEMDMEVMDVWAKRQGHWQIVAHQGTKYGPTATESTSNRK